LPTSSASEYVRTYISVWHGFILLFDKPHIEYLVYVEIYIATISFMHSDFVEARFFARIMYRINKIDHAPANAKGVFQHGSRTSRHQQAMLRLLFNRSPASGRVRVQYGLIAVIKPVPKTYVRYLHGDPTTDSSTFSLPFLLSRACPATSGCTVCSVYLRLLFNRSPASGGLVHDLSTLMAGSRSVRL
jgi:hypothetical protein